MQWTRERMYVLVLSGTHGMQHFFGRVFPPLIPLLATDLTLPLWKLGLIVSLWSGANGLAQAPLGQLSDRYDRRYILPAGVAVVGMGYLVVAASTWLGPLLPTLQVYGVQWTGSLLAITAGMVVAGIGKAATHPTGYPLLTANVDTGSKGNALGRWGSAAKLGDAAGPAFVGVAILAFPWEAVFAAITLIALAYASFLFVYMTRSALETVPDRGDGDAAGDASGYLLPVALVLLAFIASAFATRGIGTYLPTFIADAYAFSFTLFGVSMGPESVASMYYAALLLAGAAAMTVVGDAVDQRDPRTILLALYAASVLTVGALTFLPLTPTTLLLVAALVGGTLFAINPARDAIISQVTPAAREGRVFGYFWTAFLLTTSAFPVIIGYVSDVAGIRTSFLTLAAGPLLGLIPLILLYRMEL